MRGGWWSARCGAGWGRGAHRGRGWRVRAMMSLPAMQSVHALLEVQATLVGMWFDSGFPLGRLRAGSPQIPDWPLRQAHDRLTTNGARAEAASFSLWVWWRGSAAGCGWGGWRSGMKKFPSVVEGYLGDLRWIQMSGGATGEWLGYGPLANLLNEVGGGLRPKVFCVGELADQGTGCRARWRASGVALS